MSIFNALFGPAPRDGETYILREYASNPFTRDQYVVTVVDVREGWVLYKFRSGTTHASGTRTFRFIYRKYPEAS